MVYDNQMGVGDDANDGTALGGGSIVIHSGNANAAGVIAMDESQTTALLSHRIFLPLVSAE